MQKGNHREGVLERLYLQHLLTQLLLTKPLQLSTELI